MSADLVREPAGRDNGSIAEFLSQQIERAKVSGKTQRDIATALGYSRPNFISMLKRGDSKVPLERIPDLAHVLNVDPAFLFRLAMTQYWPGQEAAIRRIFGTVLTANEMEILEAIRTITRNSNPALTEDIREGLQQMFSIKPASDL